MGDLQLIMADVERSYRTGTPIYDGTARAIAAGFSGGTGAFIAFASTGTILAEFGAEIVAEVAYVEKHPDFFDPFGPVTDLGTVRQNRAMLRKLAEYAEQHGQRGPVEGWSRVWVSELSADDEYNGAEN